MSRTWKIVTLAVGLVFLLTLTGSAFFDNLKSTILNLFGKKEDLAVFQKGMIYMTWNKNAYGMRSSDESLEDLVLAGVEWVALVPTWYQDKPNSPNIHPVVFKSPSDESLLHAIEKMKSLGLKIMLKPHLDFIESEGKWRSEIEFTTEEDWQAWFKSYTDFILHFVNMAKENDIEAFCVGTELGSSAKNRPDDWRRLIKKVRSLYDGKLMYAANWFDEYSEITFWDELDYAGIDAYFPLSENERPDLEELKKAWFDWIIQIERWQKKVNKPVIFAEIGYKSSSGAAISPWEHIPGKKVDLQLQADCYTALLETFWDKPWFYGVYWWYWGTSSKMGGKFNRGFTPQNKPAQKVIERWYKKLVKKPKFSLK